jgi:hypothetical protein
MLTDTQIKSFMIPQDIWINGYAGRPNLPPLLLPARDALDIERRAQKDVNIRNEIRRYTLCCERIQGVVGELSLVEGLLAAPVVWPTHRTASDDSPHALAYLTLAEELIRWLMKSPYSRVAAIFFPPEHAKIHFQVFETICGSPKLDQLLEHAANQALKSDSITNATASECKIALNQRLSLLKTVALKEYGLVDVIELV